MSAGKTFDGPIQPENLYTLEQAARLLNVTPRLLREKWIHTGRLRYWEIAARAIAIPGHAIIALANEELRWWEENGEQRPTSE